MVTVHSHYQRNAYCSAEMQFTCKTLSPTNDQQSCPPNTVPRSIAEGNTNTYWQRKLGIPHSNKSLLQYPSPLHMQLKWSLIHKLYRIPKYEQCYFKLLLEHEVDFRAVKMHVKHVI